MTELIQKINCLQRRINSIRPLSAMEVKELRQYFRIGLTYSSNALEGNSLTESETKVILEDGLTVGGKPLRDVLEAVGHGHAYDFMYTLATEQTIHIEDIKRFHSLFYQAIDRENAGNYRNQRVFISGSQYPLPAVDEVPLLMEQMAGNLNAIRSKMHPVEFAARLHKEFVFIHPFVDGNGRVARLLMNLVLLQEGYPVVIIPPILSSEYIAALEKAHADETVFVRFIAERVIESQKEYLRLLNEKL